MLAAVVIMLSPLETGTTRGRRRERGRSRETGPSRGYLAPAGGARRSAKTRQLASRGGAAGHGPSISYMEGPCLILPGRNVLPGPAPRRPQKCRDDRGSSRARARFPNGPRPGRHQARAGPAGVRARMTGCRAVASRDASAGQCPGIGRCRGGDRLLSPVAGGDRRLPLRHVVVLAQAGGQRRRRLSPGSVSVSRTRRRQDHDERDSRQAPGDAGRLPAGYAASIRCPPSWAMAQARSASCGPAASREHRHADALPASPAGERVIGFAVHNHVDHLCKTAPGLCAHWGNAGDRVTGPCR